MTMKHLFYGGNGTTAVDSGLPLVGRFFGVQRNGDLTFFEYHGNGEEDPTGTLGFEGPHQGTVIGNGFRHFLHMLGGGDGIILGVRDNGDLMFWRYTGNGEPDHSGAKGFDGPNQGTTIGNGFHTFPHVVVAPREGRTTHPHTDLFIVNRRGDLIFFRYTGDGEHDPTGTRGFEGPNQGTQIGNGFTDFRLMTGFGGGAILGVRNNGDLMWYRYTGAGEEDPSGTLGFAENNSGNQIGNGFGHFRHLFGGLTDRGGRGRLLFGVRDDGDLLFWRYSGDGEHDPTGTRGFDGPHEGTQIGNGF
jgi:hypothetical protein